MNFITDWPHKKIQHHSPIKNTVYIFLEKLEKRKKKKKRQQNDVLTLGSVFIPE